MRTINVPLDVEDFRRMVAGDIVVKRLQDVTVQIALSDIGYPVMMAAVRNAWGKFEERG